MFKGLKKTEGEETFGSGRFPARRALCPACVTMQDVRPKVKAVTSSVIVLVYHERNGKGCAGSTAKVILPAEVTFVAFQAA